MSSQQLIVSPIPHLHSGNYVSKIMLDFMLALLPAIAFAVFIFGFGVIKVLLIAVLSAAAWEAIFQKLTGRALTVLNLSSACSGLILAMALPPTSPWWMILVGTLIMIGLGKEVFGGYGSNPFNAVLVAWVVLKMSFPDYLMQWTVPGENPLTELAPLQVFKEQGPSFIDQYYSYKDLFLGTVPGFSGQVSALMLLIGGIYLLARNVINWRIPISYLAGVFLFSGLFWVFTPWAYADPIFHLLAGGTFFAAFFLATDMPSSPTTPQGMVIFGLCAGILTVIIRLWGEYTFGAFYAVLILNMATPFLDKITPEAFGR